MKNKEIILTESYLSRIEVAGGRTSESYVLLRSTEVINAFKEVGFELVQITQWSSSRSLHTVEMRYKDIKFQFENSFNGSHAFRLRVGMVPIEFDKQIHRGKVAKEIIKNLVSSSEDIKSSIIKAEKLNNHLSRAKITEELKKEITDIIFESQTKRKGFLDLSVPLKEDLSVFEFINESIKSFIEGNYTVIIINGHGLPVDKRGSLVKQKFVNIKLLNKIYKHLEKNHIELMLF